MSEQLHFHLVDDDPNALALLRQLLESAGHRVTCSDSGSAALPALLAKPPDCVITDLIMPGLDGLELCAELRAHDALNDTRIVVLSGKPYGADRQRAREAGADGYLVKPPKPATFVADVEAIVLGRATVRFWGVRGTLPAPGSCCVRHGGNTSCVALDVPSEPLAIFDAGTGIKQLANHLISTGSRISARIFLSHAHWDHVNALPFFSPLYVQGNSIEIYGARQGERDIEEIVRGQMDGTYFPVTVQEFGAHVSYRNLREETLELGPVKVQTMLLSHPGSCLGFRVTYRKRTFCYITDNELFPPSSAYHNEEYFGRLADFVRDADLLVTDCTYTDEEYPAKECWGHSSPSEVAALAHQARVRELYLFHHDPDQDDDAVDAKLEATQRHLEALGSETRCRTAIEGETLTL